MTETGNPSPPEPIESEEGVRLIRSLKLTNFLSFGPESEEIELRGLNVLVGANGSGKSNFVEALGLLASAPNDMTAPLRDAGVEEWFYKGSRRFEIRATVGRSSLDPTFEHLLAVSEQRSRPIVEIETISRPDMGIDGWVYDLNFGVPRIWNEQGGEGRLASAPPIPQSILSHARGRSPESGIGALEEVYRRIRVYRNWSFGPGTVLREPQRPDQPDEVLSESLDNLFLILQRLELDPEPRARLLKLLRDFLPGVQNFTVQNQGSKVQLYVRQGGHNIPATRLSDGTLRWLCLLAILVAPAPPSVVVLEEPELGLHPDMINTLAEMLKKASQRMQLIVTTHSDILIDALSDVPEAVMVVEKGEGGTTVKRLNAEELKPWLEEYRLGRLWMQGQIGGTRW